MLNALHKLVEGGFVPHVIICHGGMGFGLYAKAYLPSVKLVSCMEWSFTIANSKALFSNALIDDHLRLQTCNVPLLQEMVEVLSILFGMNGKHFGVVKNKRLKYGMILHGPLLEDKYLTEELWKERLLQSWRKIQGLVFVQKLYQELIMNLKVIV